MPRLTLPERSGEVLCDPPFSEWAALAKSNAAAIGEHRFRVAGVPARDLRVMARRALGGADAPYVIETGHQPDLWHCGIWIKTFLIDRLASQLDGAAVCLAVDSDEAAPVVLRAPTIGPPLSVAQFVLATPTQGVIWSDTPAPEHSAIEAACAAVAASLRTLPSGDSVRCFHAWADGLRAVAADAANLGDLLTRARRHHERTAATRCSDVSLSEYSRSEPFLTFATGLALDAASFVGAYNNSLSRYRKRAGLRNAAQPLPDLRRTENTIELPLWWLAGGRRESLWVRPVKDAIELLVAGRPVLALPIDPAAAVRRMVEAASLAPRALGLTLYHRVFSSDLFIHGIGGGRYDQVTTDLARSYYGVEAPAFAVATMTLHLDAGIDTAGADELRAAEQALERFRRRPDRVAQERGVSLSAAAKKLADEADEVRTALAASGSSGASHRTALHELTTRLREALAAVENVLETELATARARAVAGLVLRDRTYPLCFFDPALIRAHAWAA